MLHYYISATDALGGVGGTDPQTSLMPADTTGFSTGAGRTGCSTRAPQTGGACNPQTGGACKTGTGSCGC